MNKFNRTAATLTLAAVIAGGALLPYNTYTSAASLSADELTVNQAIQTLVGQGVLNGTGNGQMQAERTVTNAELVKMIVLALELKNEQPAAQLSSWYAAYVYTAVQNGLIAKDAQFVPNQAAVPAEAANMIAKALQRDVKSVQYWMNGLAIGETNMTRGDAARLLVLAEQSIRSANAQVVSVKALNAITLEVEFDRPLTTADEATAAAQANFIFDNGLQLVNQPRLKTGAFATYIVPVKTMTAGTFSLQYKGQPKMAIEASTQKVQLNTISQVTNDTFEISSLREDGVIDYGYVISAYAGGRGANAAVLEEGNTLNGRAMQIISSLATRQATLTPEGGQPITVNYVGFTQSTDGKQEPKFRLPAGTTLTPGVKYTVSADWFDTTNASFVAKSIEPLTIAAAEQIDEASIHVTLAADPGDELFAYRSVQLKGTDGGTITAQYRVQTRKGSTGVFDLQNGAKLAAGMTYEVTPVGSWATAGSVKLEAK